MQKAANCLCDLCRTDVRLEEPQKKTVLIGNINKFCVVDKEQEDLCNLHMQAYFV